jgi:hypothetical protein
MSLDGTAKEFFLRSSLKKYFIDSLKTTEGLVVVFDKSILYETVREYVDKEWIVINFGQLRRSLVSESLLEINCCTRQDPEGIQLSKLTDIISNYLTDINQTDTLKRIPLYDTTDSDPLNWIIIGSILVMNFLEGTQIYTPDKTKVKMFVVSISWVSKI